MCKNFIFTWNTFSLDPKHPNRRKFEEVRTKATGIYSTTLEICKTRDDEIAKTIESRLLNINDLVAAETRYLVACRASFENSVPKYSTSRRPTSIEKLNLFNKACKVLEYDIELLVQAIWGRRYLLEKEKFSLIFLGLYTSK